jgi:hypothetical protein
LGQLHLTGLDAKKTPHFVKDERFVAASDSLCGDILAFFELFQLKV